MAAAQLLAPGAVVTSADVVKAGVARLAICYSTRELAGYMLRFRSLTAGLPGQREGASVRAVSVHPEGVVTATISRVLSEYGPALLSSGQPLLVNLTRPFLVGDLPLPLEHEQLIIDVPRTLAMDDKVLAGLARLSADGVALSVDLMMAEPWRTTLLPLADVVRVDVMLAGALLGAYVQGALAHAPGADLLAERVEDADSYARAASLGIKLFQGSYLQTLARVTSDALTPTQVTGARLIAALADGTAGAREVEPIVAAAPGPRCGCSRPPRRRPPG